MTTYSQPQDLTVHSRDLHPARWIWWGLPAAVLGLAGNLIASHGRLTEADAAVAIAETSRLAQHVGTLLAMGSFVCLLVLAAGWRRWAGSSAGLAAQTMAPAVTATATLVLLGAGLRGALAEYLPGGTNDDNFTDEGLFALFMLHDTAPWFAWWGVLLTAALAAVLSFSDRILPRWLGVVSALATVPPILVMAGSGAVAGAGFIAPLWLAVFSVAVGVRGLPDPH